MAFAGTVEPWLSPVVKQVRKTASTAVTKGKILGLVAASPDTWQTAVVSYKGPMMVCTQDAAAADSTVLGVMPPCYVWVTFDGAVDPGRPLTISGATAGEVIDYVASTIGATYAQAEAQAARDEFTRIVGRALNKEDEGDGFTLATAFADGDIGLIFFVGGNC